jgi:hypothetical protein
MGTANPESRLRVFKIEALAGHSNSVIANPRETTPLIRVTMTDKGLTSHVAKARVEGQFYKDGAKWVHIVSVKRDIETEVLSEQLTREMIAAMRGR